MKRIVTCVALALAGCATGAPAGPDPEATVRADFGVPAVATLTGLAVTGHLHGATPVRTSAWAGLLDAYLEPPAAERGARVVARFALPFNAVDAAYWSEWQSLPLPPATQDFAAPPVELAGASGYYRCAVHAWSPNTATGWSTGSCIAPPANFDRYEIAAYDPATSALTILLQQYD